MFTDKDLKQIGSKGIELFTIERQLDNFRNGFPPMILDKPATPGDGIFSFCEDELSYFMNYYAIHLEDLRVVKFVPASGAATRMFKHLFEFREKFTGDLTQKEAFLQDQDFNSVGYLLSHLAEIAFFDELQKILDRLGLDSLSLIDAWKADLLIGFILEENGLNYVNLPKGLILFHDYPDGARTAAEEHLVEAANYATSSDGKGSIHFTISPEHKEKFLALFANVREKYEELFDVSFSIGFSEQLPSTDTIAVDEENQPFRSADGSLLFRPAGHGALLKNLNLLEADIIFVKNIDNIVPDRLKPTTYEYKRLIGGYLLYLRNHVNTFLTDAISRDLHEEEIHKMVDFMRNHMWIELSEAFNQHSPKEKQEHMISLLNRPIRVCGMVKNEGEPGGGPFWVKESDGRISLQIVESAQMNLKDPEQKAIFDSATHFNPVDLVCSIRNFRGELFDLNEFVDNEAGLISLKSSGGLNLKAQELPGLWNGAMAKWITVFVETPIITFNPVKTVNDLLRSEHLEE
ncbi:MAG: DUF4301 family protein [Bacteroidales bacterium]|nr:DUF4301 family protein [Bacteroidales bacterium]